MNEHSPFVVPPGHQQLPPPRDNDCTSVPEPSSALFLSIGMLLLFRRSRRVLRRR